jgi:excisionase family DNA binding protein
MSGPVTFPGNTSWVKVANHIAEKIHTGELPPGTRISSIGSLSAEYGTSYRPVRKALDELAGKGLIHRIGALLFVTAQAPERVPAEEPAPETTVPEPGAAPEPEPEPAEMAAAGITETERAERFLSAKKLMVHEVADILCVSKMTVYRLVQDGEIEAWRPGRDFKIPDYAVLDYLSKQRFKPGDSIDGDDLHDGETK